MSTGRYNSFFVLLGMAGIPADERAMVIGQYTGGRTTSLRAMTDEEYRAMLVGLANAADARQASRADADLKRKRSMTLRLMTTLGVNTQDWRAVDAFCLQKRIAGKKFASLDIEELRSLERKLRAMVRKQQEEPNR